MQTFLPYPSFLQSAKVLDLGIYWDGRYSRLGKQRVETFQMMQALTGKRAITHDPGSRIDWPRKDWYLIDIKGSGWRNHAATRMWEGMECALMRYQQAICREWKRYGYNDTCLAKTRFVHGYHKCSLINPWWLGWDEFHVAHQSNLIRKWPEYYGPLFPNVPADIPYVWPSASDSARITKGTT